MRATLTVALIITVPSAVGQVLSENISGWPDNPSSRFIFCAVLEGLYEDGVSSRVIDAIIPPTIDGERNRYQYNFVYACPLCHPTYEAMKLYRMRAPFFGLKPGDRDTLGPGLDRTLESELLSEDTAARRAALQRLVMGWIERRFDSLQLSDEERARLYEGIKKGRESGMQMLETLSADGLQDQEWTECAICEGSFAATDLESEQGRPAGFIAAPRELD